jgi:hypothetical protein
VCIYSRSSRPRSLWWSCLQASIPTDTRACRMGKPPASSLVQHLFVANQLCTIASPGQNSPATMVSTHYRFPDHSTAHLLGILDAKSTDPISRPAFKMGCNNQALLGLPDEYWDALSTPPTQQPPDVSASRVVKGSCCRQVIAFYWWKCYKLDSVLIWTDTYHDMFDRYSMYPTIPTRPHPSIQPHLHRVSWSNPNAYCGEQYCGLYWYRSPCFQVRHFVSLGRDWETELG